MGAQVESILVYSGLELMGDGFMKIPFLRALRATWPQARITWLTGKGKTVYAGPLQPLVAAYLDEIIEEHPIGLHVADLWRRPLSGRRFDLVIDTQRGVRTALMLRRVRHGVFVSGAADFLLSGRRPNRRYRKPRALSRQLLDLVKIAAAREPELAAPPSLPEAFNAAARAALPGGETPDGETPDGEINVGLVPGAGGRHKCWPRARYIALARHCLERGWRPNFLLGPDEHGWLDALRAEVPEARFPLQDPAVPTEIARSPIFTVAIGRRLALAVTNDCGTAHMLAAADTPLVSLFGPSEAAKFAPLTPDLTVLRAQEFGGEAMEAIPVAAVAAVLDRKLAPAPAIPITAGPRSL